MKRLAKVIYVFLLFVMLSSIASASTILFQDQMIDATSWGVNAGQGTDYNYTFNYAYNFFGIPEAPNTEPGDIPSRGLKLEANQNSPGAAEYFTLYPIGQNFTGSYQLRFDAWMNFEVGGTGITEFLGGGIGYDNITADVASGAQAIATGNGDSSSDWRAYKSPPQFFIPDADMTAGTRNANDPSNTYYSDFLPAVATPVFQGQGGTSVAGSPGFQWITWLFTVDGNEVTIDIEKPDGSQLQIVQYDATDMSDGSSGVSTDGNISLFYADFFTSVSSNPALAFGVIDNVAVTTLPDPSTVPEPSMFILFSMGILGLVFILRNKYRKK